MDINMNELSPNIYLRYGRSDILTNHTEGERIITEREASTCLLWGIWKMGVVEEGTKSFGGHFISSTRNSNRH